MRATTRLITTLAALSSAAIAGNDLFPWDPVALTQGHEVPGLQTLTIQRAPYTYRFASPDNQRAFEAEPERFEVQWGGACGRMGPLSGTGAPERYALHDGRIFLFASDACRARFLKSPDDFLEPDEPSPTPSPQAAEAGRRWLERAAGALGGAEALDAIHAFRHLDARTVTSEGQEHEVRREVFAQFPHAYERRESWDDAWSSLAINGDAGKQRRSGRDEARELAASQCAALRRLALAHPLWLLKHRNDAGFVAEDLGDCPDAPSRRLVGVWWRDVSLALEIDQATGRPLAVRRKTRGPSSTIVLARTEYSDFRPTGALTLPYAWTTTYEGAADAGNPVTLDEIALNEDRPQN